MTTGNIIKGLEIIEKGRMEKYSVSAEHDMIYAGGYDYKISEQDKKELEKLGWEYDKDLERWTAMV